MKKLITAILALTLCAGLAVPALAADYNFSSGPDSAVAFGRPSSTDEPVSPNPMTENERHNKDAALLPPPYGIFSGNIPTDPSSLYHSNLPGSAGGSDNSTPVGIILPDASGLLPSTSVTVVQNTTPRYYSNGTIGVLYIERFKKTINVYEGEDLSNLAKGAGHFAMTSAWDGNCALAGHNRGSAPYFSFVKDLKTGDLITYTTPYGKRTYEVYSLEQIGEYDYSKLGWSADNILTLITCVIDTPELRWAATCREIR